MAAALFNGNGFVMYQRGGKDDPAKEKNGQEQGQQKDGGVHGQDQGNRSTSSSRSAAAACNADALRFKRKEVNDESSGYAAAVRTEGLRNARDWMPSPSPADLAAAIGLAGPDPDGSVVGHVALYELAVKWTMEAPPIMVLIAIIAVLLTALAAIKAVAAVRLLESDPERLGKAARSRRQKTPPAPGGDWQSPPGCRAFRGVDVQQVLKREKGDRL